MCTTRKRERKREGVERERERGGESFGSWAFERKLSDSDLINIKPCITLYIEFIEYIHLGVGCMLL